MAKQSTEQWMNKGMHLPAFMRDFHDQKSLFKTIFKRTSPDGIDELKGLNWISAHVFTIDVFLWFMARRGYTLQRTRREGEYRDVVADIQEDERESTALFASMFTQPKDKTP